MAHAGHVLEPNWIKNVNSKSFVIGAETFVTPLLRGIGWCPLLDVPSKTQGNEH